MKVMDRFARDFVLVALPALCAHSWGVFWFMFIAVWIGNALEGSRK